MEEELPEVTDEITKDDGNTETAEVQATKSTVRPRKQYVPKPEFEQITRSKTNRPRNDAFYTAYATGAQTIYDDPETIQQALQRPDWPKWKEAIVKKYQGLA